MCVRWWTLFWSTKPVPWNCEFSGGENCLLLDSETEKNHPQNKVLDSLLGGSGSLDGWFSGFHWWVYKSLNSGCSRSPFQIGPKTSWLINRCFLKWWYPQNTPNWSFLAGKPMVVVETHHFRKPLNRGDPKLTTYWEPIHPSKFPFPTNFLQASLGLDGRPSPWGNPGNRPKGCEADFSNKKNAPRFDVLVGCLGRNHHNIFLIKWWFHGDFFLGGEVMICLKREPRYSLANWVFAILASIHAFFTYNYPLRNSYFSHQMGEGFICSTPKA